MQNLSPMETAEAEAPVLLQTRANACKMLSIGNTKCGELIKNGVLETVRLGGRDYIKTDSIYQAANTATP